MHLNKAYVVVVVICQSILSCQFIEMLFKVQGCYTVYMGEEDESSITSRPAVPTNITDMFAVGKEFKEEWLEATGKLDYIS